jgi:hypothetical protein
VSPVLGRAARRLRLTVRPVRTTVGLRRLTFTVRGGTPGARTAAVRGSLVRIAGRAGRTDRRGRLTLTVRLRRSGAYTARASARGMRAASARVIVRRRRATAAR